ncbi:PD-(D/E)XK nuclease family protein [Variovorax boronicumulans]|uniref:PD-(D/E)XK nuclease family protein n=1 Tax=Variovorax boronicumulans TaxID=436515 RepID=UPI001F0A7E01|nr:PD-(D/E)XK nuclease family protein [Variovorax boronicumulans]
MAWLFNPSEGHGLGDRALRSLLVFAGQLENVQNLDRQSQDFLRPHNIHHLALSHMLVNIELRLEPRRTRTASATKSKKNLLDVVVLEPVTKLCIAIENKFGAGESPDQLKRYRLGLEKRFPGFQRIYIFLDKLEAEPKDDQWLPVGYSWLNGFLLEQENDPAISADVRRTLSEFRDAVQDEDEESTSTSTTSRLISSVAAKHGEAIEAMCAIGRPKGEKFLDALKEISANLRSAEGRASLSLFKLYHTRSLLWDECRQRARFAAFFNTLNEKFHGDLDSDVKRVKAWYSLRSWKSLVENKDEYFFPVSVRVSSREERFDLYTYIDLRSVRQDAREALRTFGALIRKSASSKNSPRRTAETFDICVRKGLSRADAVKEVMGQLEFLRDSLRSQGLT